MESFYDRCWRERSRRQFLESGLRLGTVALASLFGKDKLILGAEGTIANPLAAILSAALMLDHLGLKGGAAAIREAETAVLRLGEARSPDLGGKATTTEVAEAVLARV